MALIHTKTGLKCLCCDETLSKKKIIMHKTRRQTHSMCIECGVAYLTPKIKLITENICKNIPNIDLTIPCPGTYHSHLRNRCRMKLDIRSIDVEHSLPFYIDIFRIRFVVENPNFFMCPNDECNKIEESFGFRTKITCYFCQTTWCRNCMHQPYHENMTCIQHEAYFLKTSNGKYIKNMHENGELKFCPQCRTATTKEKGEDGKYVGCNKILCSFCGIKWCWLCDEINIDYDHFNSENINRCANKLWFGTNTNN